MDKLTGRLNRVEGQVRGIKKMYLEGRDCLDIVQQVVAARQALGTIGKDLLTDEAVKCARSPRKQTDFDKMIKSLFDIT
jgi:DNA-binding FrmR family transcriptional regulator